MQPVRSGLAPFCGFLALCFVLLEAGDVLVGEEEAVGGDGGGEEELEDGFGEGDVGGHFGGGGGYCVVDSLDFVRAESASLESASPEVPEVVVHFLGGEPL